MTSWRQQYIEDEIYPAFDDLSLTQLELKRLASVSAAVELLAVLQSASVVHRHSLTRLWGGSITRRDAVDRHTHAASESLQAGAGSSVPA